MFGDDLQKLLVDNSFIERHLSGPVLKDFREMDILTTIREPVISDSIHQRRT